MSQIGEWATSGGLRREMLKWAEDTASKHQLGYKYAEGFQRIVLESEQRTGAEVAAMDAQAEEPVGD